jgi:phosphopantetheine attachment domain protein
MTGFTINNLIMLDKKNISEVLFRLIAEAIEEDVRPIEEVEQLVDDLALDSMSFLFLTIEIEREFSVQITPEEWTSIQTFGDLVTFIEKSL